MKKLLYFFLVLSLNLTAQDRSAEGFIHNEVTKEPVANARIMETRTGNSTLSDSAGFFRLELPRKTRHLSVSHSDYFMGDIPLRTPRKTYRLQIQLIPTNADLIDTAWKSQFNVLTFSWPELIIGAVGLRYERFLNINHSVGLHTSLYLYGYNSIPNPFSYSYRVKFKGIKFTPFYRFYPVRIKDHGLFLEGKVSFGYFDFSQLTYYGDNYQNDYENYPQSFWTAGGSMAMGWMFRMAKNKNSVGNLSLGLQLFPFNAPSTIEEPISEDYSRTYKTDVSWWYINSTGAMIEIKFTLGGIF